MCYLNLNLSVHDNRGGQSPLHVAAGRGHDATLTVMLENTEDASVVDARDRRGRTPLMAAAVGGHSKCALNLLENGANVNALDK